MNEPMRSIFELKEEVKIRWSTDGSTFDVIEMTTNKKNGKQHNTTDEAMASITITKRNYENVSKAHAQQPQ